MDTGPSKREEGVTDGTTTARYTDATLPEAVRALIAWADGRPERTDALEG